jgi:hypothetical protein
MRDVFDLYEEPYDPTCPAVCFGERPKQFIAEVREPILVESGAPSLYDAGYET